MHSSDDYQELAEENKSLLLKLKQRNETVSSLEKLIEKLLSQTQNKSHTNASVEQNDQSVTDYRDMLMKTCQE